MTFNSDSFNCFCSNKFFSRRSSQFFIKTQGSGEQSIWLLSTSISDVGSAIVVSIFVQSCSLVLGIVTSFTVESWTTAGSTKRYINYQFELISLYNYCTYWSFQQGVNNSYVLPRYDQFLISCIDSRIPESLLLIFLLLKKN